MDMKEYKVTIGLEIHAELKTKTKMFCDSKNDTDEIRPNINICPICTAQPGTLPTINKEAVKSVLKMGLAVGGNLADFTEFDRKNYFYPDIPKGYQISQYKYPLVSGGNLKGVEITRIHLEEDTAKSFHKENYSLIDFNRAGVPLMELVTEPVIENAKQAGDFARELKLLLRYLRVSDANMEKGEMRVEANISVSNNDKLGTKVEVKNLNSFKVVEKAIDFEIKRQIKELENGGKIIQETRGWDENKQETFSQRQKEGSKDYRYFPDPDLPKLKISEISEFAEEELKKEIPELPWEKRERYKKDFEIKDEDIESYILNNDLANFFEEVAKSFKQDIDTIKLASNYITSDLMGLMKGGMKTIIGFSPLGFIQLIDLVKDKKISSRGTKDILKIMFEEGGEPNEIAKNKNLFQQSDEKELLDIVLKTISENEKIAEDYKNGKESVLGFLVGQGMKISGGSANPEILKKLMEQELKK